MSVTEEKAKRTAVKDGLEKGGDRDLDELHFDVVRDVWQGLGGLVSVCGRKGGLEAGRIVAEEGEVAGDARLSEGVGSAEEGSVKEVRGVQESFREVENISEQISTRLTKEAVPVVRGICEMTSSGGDWTIATLKATTAFSPTAAVMG